jgi:hypothetical protein
MNEMTKKDMRAVLDTLIEETYNNIDRQRSLTLETVKIVERLEELRMEMHNRKPRMRGKVTSVTVTHKVRRHILAIHASDPSLPQHEIARIVNVMPGRVSEVIAGKRT